MASCEERNITITATPNIETNDFDFTMSEGKTPLPKGEIDSNKKNNWKKTDHHTFIFTLKNAEGSDLAFVDDPFDVMWVEPLDSNNPDQCPTSRVTERDFNIGPITSDTLTVYNANSRKQKHKFVLRFTGKRPNGKEDIVTYDPVWTNGNGGN